MFIIWQIITIIALFHNVDEEVFTATSDLKNLIQLEAKLLSILTEVMADKPIKSKFLQKQYVLRKHQHHQILASDHKLHQPLNAYRIIKSLTIDWPNIENAMREIATSAQMFDWTAITRDPMFPDYHDLNGAVIGLEVLQETYNLETSALANGIINGVDYGSNLSASDCFELGRELYHMQYFSRSVSWLKEALTKYEREVLKSKKKVEIMEQLAYALYKSGNRTGALEVIDQMLQKRLPEAVTNNIVEWKTEVELEHLEEYEEEEVIENYMDFKTVCREESKLTPDKVAHLKCKLLIRNHHLLTPFKVEEVHVDPSFVAYIYYDVLSEREIEMAILEAENELVRTAIYKYRGKSEISEYRTAKSYIVPETNNNISAFVNRRIEDMTGLNLQQPEESQIINYGIGGQYAPHRDYLLDNVFRDADGDRIATVMFYMSDVEQGGATAFPLVPVIAKPKKGSALVWYNLLPDGQPNPMTTHCGCPVIVGSKWILIKWIHERQQVFTRPCTMNNHLWKL